MINGPQHQLSHHNNGISLGPGSHSASTFSTDSFRRGEKRIVQTSQISPPVSRGSTSIPNEEIWTIGTEVVALYNFSGKSPEDLSFHKGDILIITALTKVKQHFQFFFFVRSTLYDFRILTGVALGGKRTAAKE